VPAPTKVKLYVLPAAIVGLLGPEPAPVPPLTPQAAALHRVTVCDAVLAFFHLTMSPEGTVGVGGWKQNVDAHVLEELTIFTSCSTMKGLLALSPLLSPCAATVCDPSAVAFGIRNVAPLNAPVESVAAVVFWVPSKLTSTVSDAPKPVPDTFTAAPAGAAAGFTLMVADAASACRLAGTSVNSAAAAIAAKWRRLAILIIPLPWWAPIQQGLAPPNPSTPGGYAPGTAMTSPGPSTLASVDATEATAEQAFAAIRDAGAALVDVREPWEYEQERITGAELIPMRDVPERIADIPADRDVYVHCKVGARSARVVEYLRANGRPRTFNVAGGIDAWRAAGLPIVEP